MGKLSSSEASASASSSSAAAATVRTGEMKRKKKKGRPSLADLQIRNNNTKKINNDKSRNRALTPANYDSTPARRSTRKNPNSVNHPAFQDGGDDEDDDDERKEKKVKLVVRLPHSNLNQRKEDSQRSGLALGDDDDDSDADADLGGEGHVSLSTEKLLIDAADRRSDDAVPDQGKKVAKASDDGDGWQKAGPTTPLPDEKLLVFILDRLQKKDTYGVFLEPVDPDELPDYHEIIENPMDFGTVRKKLDGEVYLNLEELEADVLLICSNAMQYNAPDTVYFRQARSIQEIAKRDFANLRHEGDDGEPQPKVVRRGRPPSKIAKKLPEASPVDRIGPELSSGATSASEEDKAIGSNSYGHRKVPMLHRFRSSDAFVTPLRSRSGENHTDWSIEWSNEFPAHILRADMKYGKKTFTVDENKRDSYNVYHSSFDNEFSMLYNIDGDMKRLMSVGLHFDRHAYARSLATFAANLGPVAWKIASRRIESVLPAGVKFGPGWVGENVMHSEPSSLSTEKQKLLNNSSRPVTPPAPGIISSVQSRPSEEIVEAVRRLNRQNELAVQSSSSPRGTHGSPFQAQQKSVLPPNRNGFSGMFGYNPASHLGMSRPTMPLGQAGAEEGSTTHQMLGAVSRNDTHLIYPTSSTHPASEPKVLESGGTSRSGNLFLEGKSPKHRTVDTESLSSGKASYQELAGQQRPSPPVPPDLNVRVRGPGSPSSSLHIGSPQQPDLALQL